MADLASRPPRWSREVGSGSLSRRERWKAEGLEFVGQAVEPAGSGDCQSPGPCGHTTAPEHPTHPADWKACPTSADIRRHRRGKALRRPDPGHRPSPPPDQIPRAASRSTAADLPLDAVATLLRIHRPNPWHSMPKVGVHAALGGPRKLTDLVTQFLGWLYLLQIQMY